DWSGGPVAREAKALTRSAAAWARGNRHGPFYGRILAGAIRSPDPFLKVKTGWVTRRLAPDCRRIELPALKRAADKEWLLHAMGFEIANVHLGTIRAPRKVVHHLKQQPKIWLQDAASRMRDAIDADFESWRRG